MDQEHRQCEPLRGSQEEEPGPNPSPPVPQLWGHLQTHLPAAVSLIHEPPEVKGHFLREALQLLQAQVWDL